jgi:MauM/NapG family ferredoxin protein
MRWRHLRWIRRTVQLAALIGTLWLLRHATQMDEGFALAAPVALPFSLDPLVTLALLSGGGWTWLLWPALAVAASALLVGRFFCGWLCPLGACLDGAGACAAPLRRRLPGARVVEAVRGLRWLLLIAVPLAAALGLHLIGWVDPFALLYRGLNALDPLLRQGADVGSMWVADHAPGWIAGPVEWTYQVADRHLLGREDRAVALAGWSVALLGGVFALELVASRGWCRIACPLGALLGLIGRRALLARLPRQGCGGCTACATACPQGAFDDQRRLRVETCTMCGDCLAACPGNRAALSLSVAPPAAPLDVSRRLVLGGVASGLALPLVARIPALRRPEVLPERLLRPPGVVEEADFAARCVRCGACIQACPTGALQPIALEAGLDGVYTPALRPRRGACEANCTRCGEVCPTGAIPRLDLTAKLAVPLGVAAIDRTTCLPWATGETCLVCEEHCPVSPKAITRVARRHGTVEAPVIDSDACIGCGWCERVCPLEVSAILVYRPGRAPAGSCTTCPGGACRTCP